jgi:hypothetical protein
VVPFNLAIDAFGVLLSLQSIYILRGAAPWMSVGWAGAAVYFVVLFVRNLNGATIGPVFEYALILFVAIVWIVGVVRDEPQAEPWWWPRKRGPTRAERAKERSV